MAGELNIIANRKHHCPELEDDYILIKIGSGEGIQDKGIRLKITRKKDKTEIELFQPKGLPARNQTIHKYTLFDDFVKKL